MASPPRRRHLPTSPFAAPADEPTTEAYSPGDRVTHDRHGFGRVVRVVDETHLDIDFGDGTRRLSVVSAKLARL